MRSRSMGVFFPWSTGVWSAAGSAAEEAGEEAGLGRSGRILFGLGVLAVAPLAGRDRALHRLDVLPASCPRGLSAYSARRCSTHSCLLLRPSLASSSSIPYTPWGMQ